MGIRRRSVPFEHGRRCRPFGRETAGPPVLDGNSLYGDGEGRWTRVSLGHLVMVCFTTVHSFWLECSRSKGKGLALLDYDGPGAGSSVLCVGKRHCILDDCIQRAVSVEAFWDIPGGMQEGSRGAIYKKNVPIIC